MTPTETLIQQIASAGLLEESTGRRSSVLQLPFLVGRAPECHLRLTQLYVSRMHAEITREDANFVLSDVGSRYGTFANGVRVVRHPLFPGDILQFGSLDAPRIKFELNGAELSPPGILAQIRELDAGRTDLEKLRWFLEAAQDLNSSAKVERVLASLLQATMALTKVERGYVFLADSLGALDLALGMDASGSVLEDSGTPSQTVIRQASEGVDQFVVTDTLSAEGAAVPESIVAQNIRTIICIPLRQRLRESDENRKQKLLGVLYLDSRFHPGHFSEIDHELLRTIAREAAALVENAQLALVEEQAQQYHRELQIAAGIQQGLMAVKLPHLPFATVEAHSVACSAVGGDFFNVVAPDQETLSVALVDVSGKGMSAAILASTLQGMLDMQLAGGLPLAEIASQTNRYLCTKNVGKYATMLLFSLHRDGRLEYLNCGHIQPRICSNDAVQRLEGSNIPVGLFPEATYAATEVRLEPGNRIVLVSDGFTEAENRDGEAFGDERLDQAATCASLQTVLRQLEHFCATHPANDDCTIVQVVFHGGISLSQD